MSEFGLYLANCVSHSEL